MPEIFVNNTENGVKVKPKEPGKMPLHEKDHHLPRNYSLLSSVVYKPNGVDFSTRDQNEKILLIARRHVITNLPWILGVFLLLVVPFFALGLPPLNILPQNYQVVIFLFWYLATMAFFIEKFLTWYFNVIIITDERIIDIDFLNLIYKRVTDANLDKIQDVTFTQGGGIATMFNYGNVFVQTASEVPNIEISDVPTPEKIAALLQELRIEEQVEAMEGRVR